MNSPMRTAGALLRKLRAHGPFIRRAAFSCQTFSENDRVFLRHVRDPDKTHLTEPLATEKAFHSRHGKIPHSEILFKRSRDIVTTSKGEEFRATWPTLKEYILHVPRLVTPIYPLDAATIVNLLDIHVSPPAFDDSTPPLEIFEAGTGHGSLTLALARAIHAGNAHLSFPNPPSTSRGAVLHTLDISEKHSLRAREVVRGFRRGMYAGSVEYYVDDPSEWMLSQVSQRNTEEGFLYAALLDLPGTETHLAAAAEALITDGIAGCFCPSITQIAACLRTVREKKLPFILEQVVEFPGGTGVGAGLRIWDVRFARIRSRAGRKLTTVEAENRLGDGELLAEQVEREAEKETPQFEMVCRPMVGQRIVGGGFFATFKRKTRKGEGVDRAKGEENVEEGDAEKL